MEFDSENSSNEADMLPTGQVILQFPDGYQTEVIVTGYTTITAEIKFHEGQKDALSTITLSAFKKLIQKPDASQSK